MISATMFRDSTKQELTEEQEQLKREIYERMNCLLYTSDAADE